MDELYMTQEHPDHPGAWVVADLKTGAVKEVFGSSDVEKAQALTLLASAYDWSALTAAGEELQGWESDGIAFEEVETSDRRVIRSGAFTFRSFPMPIMLQMETAWGHNGAVIAGRMDEASVVDGKVPARGVLDSEGFGRDAQRLIGDSILTGISVDLGDIDVETQILEEDEDGWPTDWLDSFTKAEIMGATLTPFPAFADARVRLSTTSVEAEDEEEDASVVAAAIPSSPPPEWFSDPDLSGPTGLRITDEGRVYGHVAIWGTCHIGRQGTCVTAPTSKTDYSYFCTGYVQCEDGCEIPTGVITLGGGHAPLDRNYREAAAHYDESGFGAADVAVGEDEHGIWVAGALRPGVTDEQIRELRASSPSGDWRDIGGNLELIAVLAVNVPGFPIPRTRVASGHQTALIAAVVPRTNVRKTMTHRSDIPPWARQLRQEVRQLSRLIQPLYPTISEELKRRVHQ